MTSNQTPAFEPTDCCNIPGEQCICLPYNDALVILSAIFSVIAFLISWTWWVSLLFCFCGVIMFQTLWCCRQPSGILYTFASVAMVISLISIGLGIFFLIGYANYTFCPSFYLDAGGDNTDPDAFDYCFEQLWAGYSFVCGGLWFLISIFMFCFLKSGRHARFEEKYTCATATATPAVEMQAIDVVEEDVDVVPIVVATAVLASDP